MPGTDKKRYPIEAIEFNRELDKEKITVRDARCYILSLAGWRYADIARVEDCSINTVHARIDRARDLIQAEKFYFEALSSVVKCIPKAIEALEELIEGVPEDKTGSTRLRAATYLLETVGLGPKSMQQPAQSLQEAEVIDGQGNTGISKLTEEELDNALYAGGMRIVQFIEEKRARVANKVQDAEYEDVTDESSTTT